MKKFVVKVTSLLPLITSRAQESVFLTLPGEQTLYDFLELEAKDSEAVKSFVQKASCSWVEGWEPGDPVHPSLQPDSEAGLSNDEIELRRSHACDICDTSIEFAFGAMLLRPEGWKSQARRHLRRAVAYSLVSQGISCRHAYETAGRTIRLLKEAK